MAHQRKKKPPADDLFSAAAAREARDRALKQVEENAGAWFGLALAAIEALPSDWVGIGEDLRPPIVKQLGKPPHHNAWGSLVLQAIRRGLLVKIGARAAMRSERSHARISDIYRRG